MSKIEVIVTYPRSSYSSVVPCTDIRQAYEVVETICEKIDKTLWDDCVINNDGRVEDAIQEWNSTSSIGRGLYEGYRVTICTRAGVLDLETVLTSLACISNAPPAKISEI